MEKTGQSNKRRIRFIDKKFQTKFILNFCLLVVLGGLLTTAVLYCLAMRSTTISIINSRVVVRSTADFLLPMLVQTVVIVTILIGLASIFTTLFVSHKIVGPLYRCKSVISTLGEGDFSGDFKIRRLDQLKDLASSLNDMIKQIREKINPLKNNFAAVRKELDDIQELDISEYKRASLTKIKRAMEELGKIVNHFKS